MKSTVSKKWIASEGMLLSQCFGGRLIWHEFLFRWAFSIPPPSGSRRNVLGKSPILPIFVYCPCSSPFCPIGPLEKSDSINSDRGGSLPPIIWTKEERELWGYFSVFIENSQKLIENAKYYLSMFLFGPELCKMGWTTRKNLLITTNSSMINKQFNDFKISIWIWLYLNFESNSKWNQNNAV